LLTLKHFRTKARLIFSGTGECHTCICDFGAVIPAFTFYLLTYLLISLFTVDFSAYILQLVTGSQRGRLRTDGQTDRLRYHAANIMHWSR